MTCNKVVGVVKDLHPKLGNPYTVNADCTIKYQGHTYTEKTRINLIFDSANINKKVYFYVKKYEHSIRFVGASSMFLLPGLFLVMSISTIIIGIYY